MKTIDVPSNAKAVTDLLEIARKEAVVLRTKDGREFLLAEMDDFGEEIAQVRQNKELMEFLAERSKAPGKHSLANVKKHLGLK